MIICPSKPALLVHHEREWESPCHHQHPRNFMLCAQINPATAGLTSPKKSPGTTARDAAGRCSRSARIATLNSTRLQFTPTNHTAQVVEPISSRSWKEMNHSPHSSLGPRQYRRFARRRRNSQPSSLSCPACLRSACRNSRFCMFGARMPDSLHQHQ